MRCLVWAKPEFIYTLLGHVKLVSCLALPVCMRKTKHIEPFYLKISASILFIYYRWKKKTFFICFNFENELKDIKENDLNKLNMF